MRCGALERATAREAAFTAGYTDGFHGLEADDFEMAYAGQYSYGYSVGRRHAGLED